MLSNQLITAPTFKSFKVSLRYVVAAVGNDDENVTYQEPCHIISFVVSCDAPKCISNMASRFRRAYKV